MKRYIDADAMLDRIPNLYERSAVARWTDEAPAADVAPVRHGRWETEIIIDAYGLKHACYACSVCGVANDDDEFDFCPNCGAKMDGGAIGDPMEDE